MTPYHTWLNDTDGDSISDDVAVQFTIAPPDGARSKAFTARLLDLAGLIGLHTAALPMPLFFPDGDR